MTLWEAAQLQLMVNLLLVAIAMNIAVLVYARTAMRQREIAVRTALGASRRRIVAQLSVEALLLSVLGAGLGLGLAHPALGRRVRFLPQPEAGQDAAQRVPGPWLEIGGVVEDLQASAFDREWAPPAVYYAVAPGQLQAAELLVRVRGGDADGFTTPLRRITAALDPDLRLGSVGNLAAMRDPRVLATLVAGLLLTLGTVLLLSAAGIHALMSLTVTQRRKEIGIRTALGAYPARLLAGIFSRAAWQLGLGALLGSILGGALLFGNGLAGREAAVFLGGIVVLMLTAGLVAAVGPARRGLGIRPMEALKEE